MIFQKEIEEHSSIFYEENTELSRKDFVKLMREEIDNEFLNFKNQCIGDNGADLQHFLQEIHIESNFYIDVMEMTFIDKGRAEFNSNISLCVEERTVRKVL